MHSVEAKAAEPAIVVEAVVAEVVAKTVPKNRFWEKTALQFYLISFTRSTKSRFTTPVALR